MHNVLASHYTEINHRCTPKRESVHVQLHKKAAPPLSMEKNAKYWNVPPHCGILQKFTLSSDFTTVFKVLVSTWPLKFSQKQSLRRVGAIFTKRACTNFCLALRTAGFPYGRTVQFWIYFPKIHIIQCHMKLKELTFISYNEVLQM